MDRTNFTHPDGTWEALRLAVPESARPTLRILAARGGRFVMVDESRRRTAGAVGEAGTEEREAPGMRDAPAVLFARVEADRSGVDYHCTGLYRSPVPPLRAAETRLVGSVKDPGWYARWAHRMADALTGHGPLYGGDWSLARRLDRTRLVFPRFAAPELPAHPAGRVDYRSHTTDYWEIMPLRAPAPADDGRVKAYRKQVRDDTLPPVLVWWVGMLTTHVVLDGHDRLAAAIAEGRVPPLLVLSRRTDHTPWEAGPLGAFERRMAAAEGAPDAADRLIPAAGRQLASDLHGLNIGYGPTRAWMLAGGEPEWRRRVESSAAGWPGI
ncbi:hypothetical protein [Streptomyces sp. SID3343]|uniref:hypothetical protein n=1 Tax=Streptomyces sp. SID3343 TaxID=2690260 RepID=UPI0013703960|nr:hypothetical protein [Streptomyces sp. SID3343]MYV96708.1 hypothetical protein [Streptomyces sp. SID3343]